MEQFASLEPSSRGSSDTVSVVLFAGGRGSATIARFLLAYSHIGLTTVVNAYDDGLSTGALRDFIPGMLGPSDLRKNVANMIVGEADSDRALQALIEWRFDENCRRDEALQAMNSILSPASAPLDVVRMRDRLTVAQAREIERYLRVFLDYEKSRLREGKSLDYSGMSFGNIIVSGMYLDTAQSFNEASERLADLAGIRGRLLNVTDGENLVLVGVKEDGTFLAREADIVAPQSTAKVKEVFLLPDYLSESESETVRSLALDEQIAFLREREVTPSANPEALSALAKADVIIYGPGTQHSSLLPSYLTADVAETIAANTSAAKVFMGNTAKDHDIQSETVNSLIDRFSFYMLRKGRATTDPGSLVSHLFVQSDDRAEIGGGRLAFDAGSRHFPNAAVRVLDWEDESGKHHGGVVLYELLAVVGHKTKYFSEAFNFMVSIVVPCLNEEDTVDRVLHDIDLLDLQRLKIGKEIIVVDGGSSDRSFEIAQAREGVNAYRLPERGGRGDALRYGIERARGNIIVFFPADGEYEANEIANVIEPIVAGQSRIVFGSRLIKCQSVENVIKSVYRGRLMPYLVSRYGGLVLSTLSLICYNRFVTDPLTSIKAFSAGTIRDFTLRSRHFDIEGEIIAKSGSRQEYILEVPVNYQPRPDPSKKKNTLWQGLMTIYALVFRRH